MPTSLLRWLPQAGVLTAVLGVGPITLAARPPVGPLPIPPKPPQRAVAVTPAPGATNVKPTAPVVWHGVLPPGPSSVPWRPALNPPHRPTPPKRVSSDLGSHFLVAVTNAQGTSLYTAASPTVAVHRSQGTVTWTPVPVRTQGVTTTVLGRYTEDSVALVRGPLPGLTPRTRHMLWQQGTLFLPGVTLADLVFPQPPGGPKRGDRTPAPARPLRGEIAKVSGQTITFVGGQAVTLPGPVRVVAPGAPHATLADLRPGQFVQVLEPPPPLRKAAQLKRQSAPPPHAMRHKTPRPATASVTPPTLVQVLPTPGVVDTVFTTGSAVGEPVTWHAQVASARPSVLTGEGVSVTARDSYGDPATTGSFTVAGSAQPALDASFEAPVGTISQGQGQTTVTDHKAQAVTLTLRTQGPFARDDQTLSLGTVRFQPGPPAHMTLQAGSPLTAGSQEAVAGVVTDVYGNPVLPSTLDFTASAGSIGSSVTTQAGTGSYQTLFTAPEKLTSAPGTGELVTLSGKSEQGAASAQAQVTVNPGPVARLTLQAPSQVLAGQTASVTGTAADEYGNAVLNGTAINLATSAGSMPSNVTTQGGQFRATFQAPSQPGAVTVTASANGHPAQATIQVTAPAPSGSTVQVTLAAGSGGSVAVTGTVTAPNGTSVADAPVSLAVTGATPSTLTVTTNSQGAFSAQVTPTTSQGTVTVTATVPTQGGGTTSGQGWIDPIVYGNQAWTDTGLVVSPGQLDCVQAAGGWANQLYARVGGSRGTPVRVGANGCFVSGVRGILFLGTNGTAQSGTVDAHVSITTPGNLVPTLDVTTSAAKVVPGGQATVSGQLMAGQYPVVGASISLSATAGSLSASTVETNGQGQFQATWTAPQSGPATITASYQPPGGNAIQQSVQETESSASSVTVQLRVGATSLIADSGSTTTVTGTVTKGGSPDPDATVTLGAQDGSLSASTVTTNAQGQFQVTYTAGAQAGTATITAAADGTTAQATITLSAPSTVPTSLSEGPNVPIFSSDTTTLEPGWTLTGPAYDYRAGAVGAPAAIGGWANIWPGGQATYTLQVPQVPSGQQVSVTYGIPAGGFLNNTPAQILVDGRLVATVQQGIGAVRSTTSSEIALWTQTFSAGTYMLTFQAPPQDQGAGINVYGLWVDNAS